MIPDVDLETGHAGNGSLGGADLGRIVGEGGKPVPENRGHIRKKRPGELHTISRISCEADHYVTCVKDFVLHSDYVAKKGRVQNPP